MSRESVNEDNRVGSPTHRPALTPRRHPLIFVLGPQCGRKYYDCSAVPKPAASSSLSVHTAVKLKVKVSRDRPKWPNGFRVD